MIPNGWYPPLVWRVAPPWRAAKAANVPRSWRLDGLPVRALRYTNPVPSRFSRRPAGERITEALVGELRNRVVPGRDLLMVQFALPYGGVVREAANQLGLPYVVQLRGDDVWVWPHRNDSSMRDFAETVRQATLVVAVSAALLAEARRLANHPLPNSAVVPNGVDVDQFRPARSVSEREAIRTGLGLKDDDMVILCVGDVLERKGWLDLLDALGQVAIDPDRLLLMGAAPAAVDEFDLVEEAKRRAPGLRVELKRDVDRETLADLYRAADLFCLASHWEGLANALLEALASGLPCVATAVAGHPEVISHGVDGLLVPARNAPALRQALEAVLSSGSMRQELGQLARSRAMAIGDSGRAGERLASLLDAARRGAFAAEVARLDPYAMSASLTSA
jgi:glycosyltransferase involved in cell wall biosynthesis